MLKIAVCISSSRRVDGLRVGGSRSLLRVTIPTQSMAHSSCNSRTDSHRSSICSYLTHQTRTLGLRNGSWDLSMLSLLLSRD